MLRFCSLLLLAVPLLGAEGAIEQIDWLIAARYVVPMDAARSVIESAGGVVPPDRSELHVPRARFHAQLARAGGPAELVEPVYLRVPDAEKALA
jgi:hypothetical protein